MSRKRIQPAVESPKPITYAEALKVLKTDNRFKSRSNGLKIVPTKTGCKFVTNLWPSHESHTNFAFKRVECEKWCNEHGLDWQYTPPNKTPFKSGTFSIWFEGHIPPKDWGYGDTANEAIRQLINFLTAHRKVQKGKSTKLVKVKPNLAIVHKKRADILELWFSSDVPEQATPITQWHLTDDDGLPLVKEAPESDFDCVDSALKLARGHYVRVTCDWCEERGYKFEFGFKRWLANEKSFVKGEVRPMRKWQVNDVSSESIAIMPGTDVTEPVVYAEATEDRELEVTDVRYHAALIVTIQL